MANIFNGSSHSINIIEIDSSSIMFDGASGKHIAWNVKVVTKIPSDGTLTWRSETKSAETIDGIPTETSVVSVDELPEGYDYYIVSTSYLAAARICGKDTSNLLTVGELIYSADGHLRPLGTKRLQRN